jgi:SAM-dependent methyltransferase
MENTVCLFCCRADYRILYDSLRDLLTGAPGQFRLVVCNECQFIYLNPRPTANELATYYPDNYEPFLKVNPKAMKSLQRWFLNYGLRKRATPILRHKERGRVLDIGCATGQYLDYIKSHSHWEVFGVELDKSAAEFARQEFGLNVHLGDVASAHFPDGYFDVVTLWDVLEHLFDPFETLAEIRRILKLDGLLLVRVPITNSVDARLFGQYWAGLDVPRHFHVYSRETLFRLLVEAGFQPLRHWCISGSFFSFAISLQFWVGDNFRKSKALKRMVKLFRSVPVRLLTFPYFFIVDRLNLGAQIAVLSTKNSK